VLCLALIHHLVISRHIPLADLIAWLAGLGGDLVLEFVTPEDPMVERLLRHHDGRSLDYSTEAVEAALAQCFASVTREHLPRGTRTLYYARAAQERGPSVTNRCSSAGVTDYGPLARR